MSNKKAFEGSFLCSASVGNWNEWIDVGFDFSELIILVNYPNQYVTMTYKNGHFYWTGYVAGIIVNEMLDDYFEKSDTQFRLKTPTGAWTDFELPYVALKDIPILPPLPTSKLIFDGKVYGSVIYGGDDMINYSTEEQKTGQKWIDEKPIYQKTFINVNKTITSGTNWQVINSVDLTNVDTLISGDFYRETSGGIGVVKLNNIAEMGISNDYKLQVAILSNSYLGTIQTITLQYTKTTD